MTPRESFEAMCTPVPEAGCWLWLGGQFSNGYGSVPSGKRTGNEGAHRVSYPMFKGEIPHGSFVCHRCDTRLCVNPDHLFLGSHRENMRDMKRKGRDPVGEKHGHSKLTRNQVRDIRIDTRTLPAIAKDYGISQASVYNIRARKTWKSLPDQENR